MCLNKDMSVTCKLTYMISDAEQLYLFFNVFNINFIIVCISFSNVDDVSPIVSEQQTKLCTQEQCGGDDGDSEDDVNGECYKSSDKGKSYKGKLNKWMKGGKSGTCAPWIHSEAHNHSYEGMQKEAIRRRELFKMNPDKIAEPVVHL